MALIDNIIKRSDLPDPNFVIRPENKICSVIDNYALLLGDFRCTERGMEHLCTQTNKLSDNGHNATRVIDYKITTPGILPMGYILMDFAPGKNAFNHRKDLIQEPPAFFDKVVDDYHAIIKSELVIDPFRGDNFRYTQNGQLHFIDLFPFMTLTEAESIPVALQAGPDSACDDDYYDCADSMNILDSFEEMITGQVIRPKHSYVLSFFEGMLKKQISQPESIRDDLTQGLCNGGCDLEIYPINTAGADPIREILASKINAAIRRREIKQLFLKFR